MSEKRPAHEVIIDRIIVLVEVIDEYDLWRDQMVTENKELEFLAALLKEIIVPDECIQSMIKEAINGHSKCVEGTMAWGILYNVVADLEART